MQKQTGRDVTDVPVGMPQSWLKRTQKHSF